MRSEYAPLITRARSAISRWRRESTLVETFEADAARGAGGGRRIRLGAEVERARAACDKAKATLVECVRLLEEANGDRRIPEEAFDPETGEVGEEDVFCGKCGEFESSDVSFFLIFFDFFPLIFFFIFFSTSFAHLQKPSSKTTTTHKHKPEQRHHPLRRRLLPRLPRPLLLRPTRRDRNTRP